MIVMLGSTLSEFKRKRETLDQKVFLRISIVIGWAGVLYAAYVSIVLLGFFPIGRILLSAALGVTLGVTILRLRRRGAKNSDRGSAPLTH